MLAYSRYGVESAVKDFQYRVLNRVGAPTSSWTSGAALAVHGETLHLTVTMNDPRREGLVTSDWEDACHQSFERGYRCGCRESDNGHALRCTLEWTPDAGVPESISFIYSATNINPHDTGDTQTARFQNKISVTGYPGIRDVPVIRSVALNKTFVAEDDSAQLTIVVEDRVGEPSVNFVASSQGETSGLDYLSVRSLSMTQDTQSPHLWTAVADIDFAGTDVTKEGAVYLRGGLIAHSRYGVPSEHSDFQYQVVNRVQTPVTSWKGDAFTTYGESLRIETVIADLRNEGVLSSNWEEACEGAFQGEHTCGCSPSATESNALVCFFEWTPDKNAPETTTFRYQVVNTNPHDENDVQTAEFSNVIHVQGKADLREIPLIKSVTLSQSAIAEGEQGTLTVVVQDETGTPQIDFVAASGGQIDGVFYIQREGAKLVQDANNPKLWKMTAEIDFNGQDIISEGHRDLQAGVIAYSRYGVPSQRYDFQYRVLNRVQTPVSSWPSAALAIHGEVLKLSVTLKDPRGEGRISSDWENSCKRYLKEQYSCNCTPASQGSALVCSLEWSPYAGVSDEINFRYSATNTNPHDGEDFKTAKFSNTISVSGVAGIKDAPVIKKVALNRSKIQEGGKATVTVIVEDAAGEPAVNFISTTTGTENGLAYLKRSKKPLVQDRRNSSLWSTTAEIDLTKEDVTTGRNLKLGFGVIAYSRFGVASETKEVSYQVLNKVVAPISSWQSDAFMIRGGTLKFDVEIADPRGEGNITTNWEKACKANLKDNYSCSCKKEQRGSVQRCRLEWTPVNADDEYTFTYKATNTNRHNKKDTQTETFKRKIHLQGFEGVRSVPEIESVTFNKTPLPENEDGLMTVTIRDKTGFSPGFNIIVPSGSKAKEREILQYFFRREDGMAQDPNNPDLWRAVVDVDFFGKNITKEAQANLRASVLAHSYFGVPAKRHDFNLKVLNRVLPPSVGTSMDGKTTNMPSRTTTYVQIQPYDTRGEGIVTTNFEESCKTYLKSRYKCKCINQTTSAIVCTLEWTPRRMGSYEFNFWVKNTSPYDPSDVQTKNVKHTFKVGKEF